jgi:hypothetical protein
VKDYNIRAELAGPETAEEIHDRLPESGPWTVSRSPWGPVEVTMTLQAPSVLQAIALGLARLRDEGLRESAAFVIETPAFDRRAGY